MSRFTRRTILSLLLILPSIATAEYNPLAVPTSVNVSTIDLAVTDATRNRETPVRIYLPPSREPAEVIMFSHGLGGTCKGNAYLGSHWAKRGYLAVFLQHPGSDDSVWKDEPLAKRMSAMKQAASGQNYLLRVRDVPVVLDQLTTWNEQADHQLYGRLDLWHVGMTGHSFGAVTTQAVSGQSARFIGARFSDNRIDGAIAFSPSGARRGDPNDVFGAVKIPWMLMTGTRDSAPIGDQTVESRLEVYPHLPATIDKYELVLHDAEHSAFSDRALPGDRVRRNPNHHRAILALSTAFWDAHLRGDEEARQWLHGNGAKSVLEPKDRWKVSARAD